MKKINTCLLIGVLTTFMPISASAMHIAEGYLPTSWSVIWWIVILPFLWLGVKKLKNIQQTVQNGKILLAMATAFVFLLSSLKLPSVAGSSSHLTGIALGAILFGVPAMSVVGFTVLVFQALLLAHGGISTLGANVFSMAIIGSVTAIGMYRLLLSLSKNRTLAIAVSSFISSTAIYACTAFQLAVAHYGTETGFMDSFVKFISIFMLTQLPLAAVESVLTVLIFNYLAKYSKETVTANSFIKY